MENNLPILLLKMMFFLDDCFEKNIKVSSKEYGSNPLYCVSLPR